MPISALGGDNVVERSDRMPWYDGPTLLHHLETVVIDGPSGRRRPLPRAVRDPARSAPSTSDYRGYAGTVAAGTLRTGDDVVVLPAGDR